MFSCLQEEPGFSILQCSIGNVDLVYRLVHTFFPLFLHILGNGLESGPLFQLCSGKLTKT